MKGKQIILMMALVAVMVSCGKKTEPITYQKIAELSELGTVEYTISKVVKAVDNQDIRALFGTRKIVFNTTATIKAGFDMNKLEEGDIECNPERGQIKLTLPAAEILSLNIKPDDIHLVYEISTGFRSDFSPEERNALLAQGEADIQKNMVSMGILEDAQKYGRMHFESFLKQCGYTDIEIRFKNK